MDANLHNSFDWKFSRNETEYLNELINALAFLT